MLLGSHIAEFIAVNLYENIGNYPFGAEKMAEHFGITSQYLRRQFRKETDSP